MLFDDSSDESFAFLRELFDLFLNRDDGPECDVLELLFGVFIGNEDYIIGVEDDSIALFLWQLKLEFPIVNFYVFV